MPHWHPFETNSALLSAAVDMIISAATRAISARGQFHIVLAGGTTPRAIYEKLVGSKTDWPAWHIYFGDERCLPLHDPERNSAMVDAAWLKHVCLDSCLKTTCMTIRVVDGIIIGHYGNNKFARVTKR